MKARSLAIIAVVAAIGGLAAFAQNEKADTEPQDMALKPVKLMVVEADETAITRQFFGKVAARRTVDLAFQVGGQIQEFPVVEGAIIREGGLVGALDLRPFELALEQAQLQKAQADRTFDRLTKLKGSTVSQVTIDDAETAAGLANIALENAQIALDDATLSAPFEALIASRSVENYTTVSPGTPVVRLHDMSEIRIEIDVPEVLVQKANIADGVEVTAKFPTSDETFALEVRELTAETSAIGQTYRATFGMEPPVGMTILPGSSATVTTTLSKEGQGIIIPASAILVDPEGGTSVFRFEPKGAEEGTLSQVEIQITPTDDGRVRVLSGISVGDEIVLAGVNALENGVKARRFTGFGN